MTNQSGGREGKGMKQIITHNLGIKLVSLMIAFFCWLIIISISNPTITKRFDGIPVEIFNENAISSAEQVYEVVAGDRVDVTVKGKRSIVENIQKSQLTAKADLGQLSKVNAVAIDVYLTDVESSNVSLDWNNAVLQVALEEKITKNFKVDYKTEGDLPASYILNEVTIETPIIEVSCGISMMERINSVGLVIPLNKQKKNFEEELPLILYNADGNEIDPKGVTFNTDTVLVRASVMPTKEIQVEYKVVGVPKQGYYLVSTDIQPDTIQIAGPEAVLKDVEVISIEIDVSGKSKQIKKTIEVAPLLGPQIVVAEEYQTISYHCILERYGERTIVLTKEDIPIRNLKVGLECTFRRPDQKYTAVISGSESLLKQIDTAGMECSLDLRNLDVGTHSLLLRHNLPEGLELKNNIRVQIDLKRSVVSE